VFYLLEFEQHKLSAVGISSKFVPEKGVGEFNVQCFAFNVQCFAFKGSMLRVQGFDACGVQGSMLRVQLLRVQVQGFNVSRLRI
jgi:hypothetical protein